VLSRTVFGREELRKSPRKSSLWDLFAEPECVSSTTCAQLRITSSLRKTEWFDKARNILYNVCLLSFEPHPNSNIICATRPEPEDYLCCQAWTRTLALLPGLNQNISCAARPEPEHYLCCQAWTRTLALPPGLNQNIICATRPEPEDCLCCQAWTRTLSVLPGPNQNIICAARPEPEHYLCCQARTGTYLCCQAWTRTLSVLPGPTRRLSVLPGLNQNIICASRPTFKTLPNSSPPFLLLFCRDCARWIQSHGLRQRGRSVALADRGQCRSWARTEWVLKREIHAVLLTILFSSFW
jgi:hypothetical protein